MKNKIKTTTAAKAKFQTPHEKGKAAPAKVVATPAKATPAKAAVEKKDKYGARLGTIRAKTNAAFSRVWKTMAQIEAETGIPPGKISGNLRDQVASGLLEVQEGEDGKSQFRLAK